MHQVPGADHRVIQTGTGNAARQTAKLLAVGLAAAMLLGAEPLRQWAETLPNAPLARAAAKWETALGQLGLNTPYATLRAWLRQAERQ